MSSATYGRSHHKRRRVSLLLKGSRTAGARFDIARIRPQNADDEFLACYSTTCGPFLVVAYGRARPYCRSSAPRRSDIVSGRPEGGPHGILDRKSTRLNSS